MQETLPTATKAISEHTIISISKSSKACSRSQGAANAHLCQVCQVRTWVVKHRVIGVGVEQHPVVPAHPSNCPSATECASILMYSTLERTLRFLPGAAKT